MAFFGPPSHIKTFLESDIIYYLTKQQINGSFLFSDFKNDNMIINIYKLVNEQDERTVLTSLYNTITNKKDNVIITAIIIALLEYYSLDNLYNINYTKAKKYIEYKNAEHYILRSKSYI
jgi:hypothetical protein